MFKSSLTEVSFFNACVHASLHGGAIMLATPHKQYWVDKVKKHCTPCTTVYIRDPDRGDGASPVTAVLVDSDLNNLKKLDTFLANCSKKVSHKHLKGWTGTPDVTEFSMDEALLPY